jgi:hypothetical protein
MTMAKRVTKRSATARVIRWEGFGCGVAVDHGNGSHDA